MVGVIGDTKVFAVVKPGHAQLMPINKLKEGSVVRIFTFDGKIDYAKVKKFYISKEKVSLFKLRSVVSAGTVIEVKANSENAFVTDENGKVIYRNWEMFVEPSKDKEDKYVYSLLLDKPAMAIEGEGIWLKPKT